MTQPTVRDQIQAGINARTRMDMPLGTGVAFSRAYRQMLGLDGTSVEDAARAAHTPTGPPIHVLEDKIRARRAHAWGHAA
ncbi:hypothetical protein DEO23_14155 [Brachybacterium endophyticum]|uniref:Uncharacterized protein n=1 Tax=Brachybacterium endophyticum TaxID=2182385 RepID=A0A2U2RH69_9MICO|nr:hypothetical protein [Brachybacterium endophyticum]PWH05219.1 hypothetical protein DEO23_14155 [Brachybacterium endophyticum]